MKIRLLYTDLLAFTLRLRKSPKKHPLEWIPYLESGSAGPHSRSGRTKEEQKEWQDHQIVYVHSTIPYYCSFIGNNGLTCKEREENILEKNSIHKNGFKKIEWIPAIN